MPHLLLLAGDGIGPEVMGATRLVIDAVERRFGLGLRITEHLVGGAAIDVDGVPLSDATLAETRGADAILLGAVGGPKWDRVAYDIRPEAGLLKLRRELQLFANLRPALCHPTMVDHSSLKPELVRGLDIVIVRELTGGIYFGEPRGIETLPDGQRRGVNTQVYTTEEIRRVARVAFQIARGRQGRVVSAEKANVMESGRLWREEVTRLHGEEFADVQLSHMYADALAMALVKAPKQFDVIVTDNLFGDILSDEAAMLTGSIGMLPSASLGAVRADGRTLGLYEPVHGSAPDIAGRGIANPLATILSFALALRHSLAAVEAGAAVEAAAGAVLEEGLRTADLARSGETPLGTQAMGEAVARHIHN